MGLRSPHRFVLTALVLLALASPLVLADPPPVRYRLGDDAGFEEGCFEPCMCPIFLAPMEGGFRLRPSGRDGGFRTFAVTGVAWAAPALGRSVSGSGTYRREIGGEHRHRLELDLVIDGAPAQHFDSGLVVAETPFPRIAAQLTAGELFCFGQVLLVDAHPGRSHPHVSVTPTDVAWDDVDDATGFDLVYGDVAALAGGDLSAAVSGCLADATAAGSAAVPLAPPLGGAHFYAVRARGSAEGDTYHANAPAQAASRDLGIEQAPGSCP